MVIFCPWKVRYVNGIHQQKTTISTRACHSNTMCHVRVSLFISEPRWQWHRAWYLEYSLRKNIHVRRIISQNWSNCSWWLVDFLTTKCGGSRHTCKGAIGTHWGTFCGRTFYITGRDPGQVICIHCTKQRWCWTCADHILERKRWVRWK